MKNKLMLIIICLNFIATNVFSASSSQEKKYDIIVLVTDLKNQNGNIILCLWKESDSGFPRCDKGSAFMKQTVPANQTKIVFKDVPEGTYAVSVLHDEKGSGKMEVNFMGMPKSGIGVSMEFSKPPSFAKSKFTVPHFEPINIKINYLSKGRK